MGRNNDNEYIDDIDMDESDYIDDMEDEVIDEDMEIDEYSDELTSVDDVDDEVTDDNEEEENEDLEEDSLYDETKDSNSHIDENLDEDDKKEEKFDLKAEIISWVKIFVSALIIATILDNFIIINANVPSGSMENTIMTGDRMIGNRLAYTFSDPDRGDVIIFKYPDNEEENFVKRVIGLPGDKVTITDGKIYINDNTTPLEEEYLPNEWLSMNNGLEYEVPQDCYFVLGDNRNVSSDARYWENKYVHKDKIIAKASFVYWPFANAKMIKDAEYSIDK